jgi:2-octaprenyl-6-methoxyphenol hydroxylase
MTSIQQYDVVIVGGGMVGASLSLLLSPLMQQGVSVALVDQHPFSSQTLHQASFDDRTTALSLGTKRILEDIHVWPLLDRSATPIEHIQVSQQHKFGRVRLHAKESQVDAMGYVVENAVIGQGLISGLQRLEGLTQFAPAHVEQYEVMEQGTRLHLECDGEKRLVQAGLLILADGANSQGCRQLGVMQTKLDYQQKAVVCNVSFDRPHDQWAYERFTSQGPLALLPMSQNRFAVVWCNSTDRADHLVSLSDADFQTELQSVVGYDKGRIVKVGERFSYPLALVKAQEQVRRNLVVLGNAAHALHPVAGQGFNLALRDALCLAEVLIEAHRNGDELGDVSILSHYQRRQTQDQAVTIGMSHALPVSFMQEGLHWSILRGLAMTAMDLVPTAKQLFANQAMGLVGKSSAWRP